MLKESIELHRDGHLDEAERGYRARLADDADDVDALHLLALLRQQRGDDAEGERLLARAQALAPDEPLIEVSIASLRFRQNDHDAAQRGFERALTLDPNLGGAHAGIGQIALLRGERELAERHFRIALRAAEEPDALAGLGALLLERDDVDGALRHLGRAADLRPNDAMVQMLLGQAFMKRGTPAFAETAFDNALRLQPTLHQARLWLAQLYFKTQRWADAEPHYRALLGVPELVAEAHFGIADVARAENRLAEAADAYRRGLALQPGQSIAVRALAWTLLRLGRDAEAIAIFDGHLARAPGDIDVRGSRGDLLMVMRRYDDALSDWSAVVAKLPNDRDARARLALIEEHRGHFDAALGHADAVLAKQPENSHMLLLRARAMLRSDDDAAARAALAGLDTVTALAPEHRQLRLNYLGRLHDRAGEFAAAVRCFIEAQHEAAKASSLPPLGEPRPELDIALAEPTGPSWAHAPVLLLGTPGSKVGRIAALLADQPGLTVLRDRIGNVLRDDDFNRPRFAHYCGALDESAREALRERYLAPLRSGNGLPAGTLVDWLPRWDTHLLALVRRAMPGTRLVIVGRDPRDALLDWIAFGWAAGFACPDPHTAAGWLIRADRHLHHREDLDEPRRLVVDADAVVADPEHAGGDLARFLGLDQLRGGPQFAATANGLDGLPTGFPAGHWRQYSEALAPSVAMFPVR